jgi:NifU-like protein involved in Fe-S cluster formation
LKRAGDRELNARPRRHGFDAARKFHVQAVRQAPILLPEEAAARGHMRAKTMIDDVYNAKILGFAGNIGRIGRLPHPDASARAHSKLCGSTVTVDLSMQGGVVTDFAHDVKACALGQASSAIMAEHVVGASAEELRAVRETMLKMLKENGAPPQGRFADLKYLEPVRDYKARHASTMLTFDAVVDAIGQIERKQAEQAA